VRDLQKILYPISYNRSNITYKIIKSLLKLTIKSLIMNSSFYKKSNWSNIFAVIFFLLCLLGIIFYFKITPKFFTINLFFLLPTFLAFLLDKSLQKHFVISILLCNLAGIIYKMPDFIPIIKASSSSITAIINMMRLEDLAIIYLFSLAGFLLAVFIPSLYSLFKITRIHQRKRRLMEALKQLENQWDFKD